MRYRRLMTKLWLDDLREAPEGWMHVRSYFEAINILSTQKIEDMSFDHDLGEGPLCDECSVPVWDESTDKEVPERTCSEGCACDCHEPLPTGYDLVKWMAMNNLWPKNRPTVHSQNPVGRENIEATIVRYGPYGEKHR